MKEKPHPDMSFEMEARASGFLCVAGVDEAGRGPLAGPVVAGAVILPVLAEELTSPTLSVHASITARNFFLQRGYRLIYAQQVERQGQLLTNFYMKKEK